ncbi:lipase chaperone [Burkholderiaceae bacterium DAT-1]|nr:lipase chaperone [Burkholderiaceae bacterium DAT-1]
MRWAALAVSSAAAGGLIIWMVRPDANASAPVATLSPAPQHVAAGGSLFGTRMDGYIRSEEGELVLSPELLRRFEYFLSQSGEKSLGQIRSEIEASLDQDLALSAAKQAKELLGRYLSFREALKGIKLSADQSGQSLSALQTRLQRYRDTRKQFFSEKEIAALFGSNDREDDLALQRVALRNDSRLSDAEKRAREAALDATLSVAERQQRDASISHLSLASAVDSARAKGASTAQIFEIRAQTVGAEAAQRLAELDREESAWQARIESYTQARQHVLQSASTVNADTALQQLRDRMFSKEEQLRLPAFEH